MRRFSNSAGAVVRLGVFLALALVLALAESFFLPPLPVPGVKLGLANAVTLFLLLAAGFPQALTIACLRVFLVGFLTGNFLNLGFALSLAGAGASSLVMAALLAGRKRLALSVFGVSIGGAAAHNLVQVATFALVTRMAAAFFYLPLLLLLSLPTGLVIGYLAGRLHLVFRHW